MMSEPGAANRPPASTFVSHKADIQYTDVIVIGNGPSGICLSYLLSGNWPYYNGAPHPNEYLQLRLEDGGSQSLIEQDLEYLSNGLEGRSSNPLALLFDALTHPEADMGMEACSLLRWQQHPEHSIDHVVLGRGAPGGAWQMMEGDMQTLSLGNWMQLPNHPFKQWLANFRSKVGTTENLMRLQQQNRASMEEVREYYLDYVRQMELAPRFRSHATVTSVERVLDVTHSIDDESGEQAPCSSDHSGKLKWEVRGHVTEVDEAGEAATRPFCCRAPNVVLATGSYDLPNKLGAAGESLPYVLHSVPELEQLLATVDLGVEPDPLVIVGAGLSAADAILYAQNLGAPVVHIFRRDVEDPLIIYRKLPELLYPEYHAVHEMMRNGDADDGSYKSYPEHTVKEFLEDGNIIIRSARGDRDTIIKASCVLVLIGARPDLSFLPDDGRNLGTVPGVGINCKHNPIDVDPFSLQSLHEPGLFAMGPLVGDNFVRFLQGGSLGIAAHLWRKRMGKL